MSVHLKQGLTFSSKRALSHQDQYHQEMVGHFRSAEMKIDEMHALIKESKNSVRSRGLLQKMICHYPLSINS